jgi:hypothetical protein
MATISYFAIWLFSTVYEFHISVPKRWEIEKRALLKAGLKPKSNCIKVKKGLKQRKVWKA